MKAMNPTILPYTEPISVRDNALFRPALELYLSAHDAARDAMKADSPHQLEFDNAEAAALFALDALIDAHAAQEIVRAVQANA